jgi:hypothetical protein
MSLGKRIAHNVAQPISLPKSMHKNSRGKKANLFL